MTIANKTAAAMHARAVVVVVVVMVVVVVELECRQAAGERRVRATDAGSKEPPLHA